MQAVQEHDTNSQVRIWNGIFIKKNKCCQEIINSLRQIENFLIDFSYLSFGRSFLWISNGIVSLQRISTSLELTMENIICCCENGCIADANTLLRKYRDDIFFYLYIVVYDSIHKSGSKSAELSKMEEQIKFWLKNDLTNLNINTVLKAIAFSPDITDAVNTYNLKASFDKIGKELNGYVHSNGYCYYNQSVHAYENNTFLIEMKSIEKRVKYITTVFLFLLILCSPCSIMSEDYVDYLECNRTPPKGSEYWVAPFISKFLQENLSMIDKNCIDYLKSHSDMEI